MDVTPGRCCMPPVDFLGGFRRGVRCAFCSALPSPTLRSNLPGLPLREVPWLRGMFSVCVCVYMYLLVCICVNVWNIAMSLVPQACSGNHPIRSAGLRLTGCRGSNRFVSMCLAAVADVGVDRVRDILDDVSRVITPNLCVWFHRGRGHAAVVSLRWIALRRGPPGRRIGLGCACESWRCRELRALGNEGLAGRFY